MGATHWLGRTALAGLLAVMAGAAGPAPQPGPVGPPLTMVRQFGEDFHLVGIGVSKTGRVFATQPTARARSGLSMVEVDTATGKLTPYPDAAWNTVRPAPDGKPEWALVQALWDDSNDHLWALDTGVQTPGDVIPAKLVEFDLKTNQPIRTYTFDGVVLPQDALNDVRIDVPHQAAYLTNAGPRGGVLVVDLRSGQSRMVLVGDRSAVGAPNQHLMIGDQLALSPATGKPVVIQTDGIALSPDARWLYYRPLTDHNYWRVPTAALRDATLSPAALSKQVQFLGTGALSGGLIMDRHGTLYAGDVEHSTVAAFTLHGSRLQERVFVRAPGQLEWADGFAISQGELYIADSHLNEVAFKNDLPRSGPYTIFKVKLPGG